MIRSIIVIVFILIALTQCLPSNMEVTSLKLNQSTKGNVTKNIEDFKLFTEDILPYYEQFEYTFGRRLNGKYQIEVKKCILIWKVDKLESVYWLPSNIKCLIFLKICKSLFIGDDFIGLYAELNFLENRQDVQTIVQYPTTGRGKLVVTYVGVYIAQVKLFQ